MRKLGLCLLGLLLMGFAGSVFAAGRGELDDRIRDLTEKFIELQQKPDKAIPPQLLRKARGIVLLSRVKAGFLFAYQGGGGVAMVKDAHTDKWGPAAFVAASEASLGFQVGGEQNFFVILLMTTNATGILTNPNYEFGGEARGTAGDTSSGVQSTVSNTEKPVLVYSDRQGLFGGAAVKGGAFSPDEQDNLTYYDAPVTMTDILFDHKVQATDSAAKLAERIHYYSVTHSDAAQN